ncbi:MAG: hypothetical protein BAJALOKI2v1_840014 [Promethearchaeota archaeon]|nr:MAG: hypothetical protein BAJALOKI2v1_840014 [Candidatus Lokiarchaeota archaeon]
MRIKSEKKRKLDKKEILIEIFYCLHFSNSVERIKAYNKPRNINR